LIDYYETGILVASTVVPAAFVDVDSLEEMISCFLQRNLSFSKFVSSFFLTYGVTSNNNISSNNNVSSHASHDTSNKAPPTSHPMRFHQQSSSLQLASTTTANQKIYVFFGGLFIVFDWHWENMSDSFADPVGLSP
jgi:hypothetical protein